MGLDSEMDARDLMPSVTTATPGEGCGGASGRKTKGKSLVLTAASPQALGRAIPAPRQGIGLSDKRL